MKPIGSGASGYWSSMLIPELTGTSPTTCAVSVVQGFTQFTESLLVTVTCACSFAIVKTDKTKRDKNFNFIIPVFFEIGLASTKKSNE